jgi:hypothetical protein
MANIFIDSIGFGVALRTLRDYETFVLDNTPFIKVPYGAYGPYNRANINAIKMTDGGTMLITGDKLVIPTEFVIMPKECYMRLKDEINGR